MGAPEDLNAEGIELVLYGDATEYRDGIAAYERALQSATMPHEYEQAARLEKKLNSLKAKLVGPVKSLDASLKDAAEDMLTTEQVAKGPLPPERTPLRDASTRAMWGLIILGILLIVGFFTRIAALGGAVMLVMFYLVWPPWPGVPEAPGPDHSLFVNKNIIEAVALLGIAALPTGSWFGLDGIVRWIFRSKK